MYRGFIKLFRSIDDWEWRTDPNTLSVWLYMLTHARHEAGSWQGIPLKAGQLITGRDAISKATGVSERGVRTALEHLKKSGNLTIKPTNKFSIVTVEKWDFWQGVSRMSDQQTDQQPSTNRPATDQQPSTNKNVNNEKNGEEPPPTPSTGETPDGVGGAAYIENNLRGMTAGNWDELRSYLEDGLNWELIRHAVDEAAAQGKRTWAYVRSILNRYVTENIESVAQAKATDGKPLSSAPPSGLSPWLERSEIG